MGAGRSLGLIVPWQDVPVASLVNLIEELVSRDGTDYGEQEVPLTTKVEQVKRLLQRGEMVIWFDEDTESISLFAKDQLHQLPESQ